MITLKGSANLAATGQSLANVITGTTGANRIDGSGGNDTLNGRLGNDTLIGGTGDDLFVFDTAPGATTNRDLILDFDPGDDRIRLENAVFAGLNAGTLTSGTFVANASGTATSTSHRIIYETDTGNLYFDKDGSGSGGSVLFATTEKNLGIAAADFLVI